MHDTARIFKSVSFSAVKDGGGGVALNDKEHPSYVLYPTTRGGSGKGATGGTQARPEAKKTAWMAFVVEFSDPHRSATGSLAKGVYMEVIATKRAHAEARDWVGRCAPLTCIKRCGLSGP